MLKDLNKETKDFYKKYISTNRESVDICLYPSENISKSKDLHVFNTKYGEVLFSKYSIKRGNTPSIRSAVDKTNYFLSMLENLKPKIFSKIELLTEYIEDRKIIIVQTKYGKCKVLPGSLLRGNIPTMASAVNKTNYLVNRFKEVHGDKYNYSLVKYNLKDNRDKIIKLKCDLHGEFDIKVKYHIKSNGCQKCGRSVLKGQYASKKIRERDSEYYSSKKSNFYIIRLYNEEEEFFKIGVTIQTLSKRFRAKTGNYKYEVVFKEQGILEKMINKEQKLLKLLKKHKYTPKQWFGGYTECVGINPIKYIK